MLECVMPHTYSIDIMLLLTNCEVHTGPYSDRSLDVRTERSNIRTKYYSPNIFPYGPHNWSIRALLYSHKQH